MIGFSCASNKDKDNVKSPEKEVDKKVTYTVARAPEWTALFKRDSGWFGGDGIFAIPLSGVDSQKEVSDDTVLFVFSDTMVGEIEDGKLQPGYKMVNNSMARISGGTANKENIEFLVAKDGENNPATLFTPQTPDSHPDDYYWLGDGFVNQQKGGDTYLFAYRIRNTNDGSQFPFKEVGNALLVLPNGSQFPFEDARQLDIPFFASTGGDAPYVSFGVGVLANTPEAGVPNGDGYVYVYGVHGMDKQMVAARVKPEDIEDFSQWEFWGGEQWSNEVENLAAINDSVSNELSVTPIGDNLYALVYEYSGIYPEIMMQFGPSPIGPFGSRQEIYNTRNDVDDPDLFTYNAKAHPAISKPGELLVSYNVNSFKFFDIIESKPNLYRPRFIKILFNKEK